MEQYAEILRELREDRGLGQKELANFLGITQQMYSRYELAVHETPLRHLIALSEYYDVPLDYLAGHWDEYKPGMVAKMVCLSPEAAETIETTAAKQRLTPSQLIERLATSRLNQQ